jgi:hypothetical protein
MKKQSYDLTQLLSLEELELELGIGEGGWGYRENIFFGGKKRGGNPRGRRRDRKVDDEDGLFLLSAILMKFLVGVVAGEYV